MRFLLPMLLLLVAAPAFAHTPLEPQACTMEYAPVCGAKQVQCVRAPCYPVYQTYGNSCTLAADKATFVHEGECTAAETGPVIPREPYTPPAHCVAWFDGCNQCGRDEHGAAYCTEMACIGEQAPGYCTKYETSPADTAPSVEPSPASPEPVPSTEPVPVEPPGFFATLWSRVLTWFSWF